MITNDINRARSKLAVLRDYPESWGVIIDVLQFFDKSTTGNDFEAVKYVYFIEEMKKKYEEFISTNENKSNQQQKLFNHEPNL